MGCQNPLSHFRQKCPVGKRVQDDGVAVHWKATWKFLVSTIWKADVTSSFSGFSSYHNLDAEHHIWSHCGVQPRAAVAGQWEPYYKTSGLLSRLSCSPGIQLKNEFFEETSPSNHLHSGSYILEMHLKLVLCSCFLCASLLTVFIQFSYNTQLSSPHFAN